ncbi:sensor histidine kinase [Mucilaginibacter lacusdianchii]|uniref:sensor histidine kinase n=1 Tax=Mucilaginibacter lacusdianchii TaxID=2684211 RepID=UPI00131D984A|nr:HAMP domain-containing sensor histidine kinase [Mucilaginibacter sp. JXJ CY 39]
MNTDSYFEHEHVIATEWFNVNNIANNMGDIAGKKTSIEQEQERMIANLLQRNRDLEQFAYIISHNLRAPMANIVGLSGLLSESGNHNQGDEQILQALRHSVNMLDKVITDLNDLVQIDNDTEDNAETVNLSDLVHEIYLSIDHLIEQSNAKVICDFDAIPELRCLKSYLYSVFQNLIVNSIKYRREDLNPEMVIVSRYEGNKVCVYFKDNGRGIDLYKHGHQLFGFYKRFDHDTEGKGMGLFMVKRQVERLGGTISVQSKPNAGTEFRLEFPINIAKF